MGWRRVCPFISTGGERAGALAGDTGATAPLPACLPLRPGLGLSAAATRHRRGNVITLVVGGTSGLGLEIARNRSKQGDDIVVTGRDQAKAAEVASSLGSNARALVFDLTEPRRIA